MIVIKKPDRTLRRQMCWGRRKWGKGIPLPSRLAGLGECRSSPKRGSGQSPGRKQKRFWSILYPKNRLVNTVLWNITKCCADELLEWRQNECRIKYRTFLCLILSEIVNQTLYQKRMVRSNTPGNPRFSKKAPIRGISRHSINKIQFSNPKFILCDVKKPTTECAVFSGALTMYLRTNSRR